MIIVDTNVLSELMKGTPGEAVMQWFTRTSAARLYTTSVTQAEILHGIGLLPAGKRRDSFAAAAEATFAEDFGGRILPFDSAAARCYARIAATRQRAGRPISHFDAQIAGIAESTGASVATRNVRDFELCGIGLVNPWDD
ncbi:MAG: type II toxin-antitoxin system VapC family toxin [Burkholderiales bacterium]|nr:type II toxin-antitoxin system VapC family toxin [Burkholderiales bacterium]